MADVEVQFSGELTVAKADDDQRLVFGWANVSKLADGSEVWDSDNEHAPPDVLEAAAYDFVLNSREGGTDHDGGDVRGQLVESMVFTVEKQQQLGLTGDELPEGWWVGFYVDDDAAWQSVKDGQRLMFSIDATASVAEEAMA